MVTMINVQKKKKKTFIALKFILLHQKNMIKWRKLEPCRYWSNSTVVFK